MAATSIEQFLHFHSAIPCGITTFHLSYTPALRTGVLLDEFTGSTPGVAFSCYQYLHLPVREPITTLDPLSMARGGNDIEAHVCILYGVEVPNSNRRRAAGLSGDTPYYYHCDCWEEVKHSGMAVGIWAFACERGERLRAETARAEGGAVGLGRA